MEGMEGDTSLVLTSDNFHLIFPPPFLSRNPWWYFLKTLTWCRLYRVFTYIYSLLIKKDNCDHQNISVKFPCVTIVQRSLHFSVRILTFFSYLGIFIIRYLQFLKLNVDDIITIILQCYLFTDSRQLLTSQLYVTRDEVSQWSAQQSSS